MERLTHLGTELSDEKQSALQELHDLMARTVAIMDGMEAIEHRVATIIEGGRQQLSHVVADLRLPEMRAELRAIRTGLERVEKKL
jgi:hypothetical protein